MPAANPTVPTTANTKPDQLGELQRRHRLLLGDRSEAGCDEAAEEQAVGMLTGPAPRADREDDGLRAQNDGGGDRADGRRQQRRR